MTERSDLNVVIIDDSTGMSSMISDFLKEKFSGISVSTFSTGEEALFKLKSAPSVFILDYNLNTKHPQALNGIQIMMQLKKKFESPVVILSAQDREDVAANLIKFGAYAYVQKNQDAFHQLQVILNGIGG